MAPAPDWLFNSLIYLAAAVVVVLFLIGLELEPQGLWSLRVPIFGWGSAQVAGCAVLIALQTLGRVMNLQAPPLPASSQQALDERHLRPTPGGPTSFTVLLFQDVAAIPTLA